MLVLRHHLFAKYCIKHQGNVDARMWPCLLRVYNLQRRLAGKLVGVNPCCYRGVDNGLGIEVCAVNPSILWQRQEDICVGLPITLKNLTFEVRSYR